MNKLEDTNNESNTSQATAVPYIRGFLLSLICTLIPYYLVVHKPFESAALLATIIGFAVLQLVIQVVFFLHIGREKKPRFNLLFLVSTIGIILLVVVGSIWIMNHLHHNMSGIAVTDKITSDEAVYEINGVQAGSCSADIGVNYRIEIKNNIATPRTVDAQLCDTLTIINLDNTAHTINYGAYNEQATYAGETGKTIRPGRNMLITFTELGAHTFHDSTNAQLSGSFTVAPRQ